MQSADVETVEVTSEGVGAELFAYAQGELRHALDFLSWRRPRLHLAVHHARKALRRVRATLALGEEQFGASGRRIDLELQGILRALSPLRDGQALVEVVEHLAKRCVSPEEVALVRRAQAAAVRRRGELARNAPEGSAGTSAQRLTLELVLVTLPMLPWERLHSGVAREALERSAKRAERARLLAVDGGGDAAWHRWRRRARRLTQQHRALGDHAHHDERERAKDVAERLGELQDLSLLVEHCGKVSPFSKGDRWGLRLMAHRERERALGKFPAARER